MSTIDILRVVNRYPVSERLLLVEAILKAIREEEHKVEHNTSPTTNTSEALKDFRSFIGILNEQEADAMSAAISESRQVDLNEW